jgi:hypothetical protein
MAGTGMSGMATAPPAATAIISALTMSRVVEVHGAVVVILGFCEG